MFWSLDDEESSGQQFTCKQEGLLAIEPVNVVMIT